jgi:hypothetical protein
MATIGQALTSPEPTWKRIDDTDNNFVYDSNWTIGSGASYYNGASHMLSTKTGKVDFYFYGSKIRIMTRGNTSGSGESDQVKITIDGVSQIFSSVSSTLIFQMLSYEKTGLPKATHKVTIENLVSKTLYLDCVDIDSDGYMTNGYINKALIQTTDGGVISYIPKDNKNLIPIMTNNTSPSGVASASSINSGGNDAWYAFNKITSSNDGWLTGSSTTGWLQYKFPTPKTVRMYIVYGAYTTSYSMKNWTFEGSNDGINYDILDTQVNNTFAQSEKKVFVINNYKPYLYYRLNITANNGGVIVGLTELEMYDTSSKIMYVDNNENDFIYGGMSQGVNIDFSEKLSKKSILSYTPSVLGNGKIFKTTVDTSQIPIKLVQIK